jgi:hypothetical protein
MELITLDLDQCRLIFKTGRDQTQTTMVLVVVAVSVVSVVSVVEVAAVVGSVLETGFEPLPMLAWEAATAPALQQAGAGLKIM